VTYEEWEAQVPREIREDAAWTCHAYRIGLFIADLADADAAKLWRMPRMRDTADQLGRSAANISSNVVEGFSRGTGKDRARFYEYALGSARECRDWYYKARNRFASDVNSHRMGITTDEVRLLLAMIRHEKRQNNRIAPKDEDSPRDQAK
jgi:four helix bundle protein